MTQNLFDQLVSEAEVIGGADLYDKAELVGKEFIITGVTFTVNERNVEYVYVEAVTRDGKTVEFNDSSKAGVRGQISNYLSMKEIHIDPSSGEKHAVKIHVPRGLRVSTFDVQDARGKTKQAKTYYLTSASR